MKNSIVTIFAIVSSAVAIGQVQFGVKAGLNLSTLYNPSDSDNPGYKTSFNAGVLVSVPLFPGFYLQPEIMYSGQGYEQSFSTESMHIETGYLNVPVLFKYQHEIGLFAETGPQIGFLLSANREVGSINTNIKDDFESTDYSWAFGLGYKFLPLPGDRCPNLGLTNTARDSQNETAKNSVFQLGLFYMFEFNK